VALNILLEVGLSYLGLGVQSPLASWGNMVAEGKSVLRAAWWVSAFPGLFIVLTVMAFNLLGDGLRDVTDPRRRAAG
jgi:peptide/nickel transport system permease protein